MSTINAIAQIEYAMRVIQKKIIKSVTKRFVTDIIQESTDAIYQFEDDSITLADYILRSVLKSEIRNLLVEAKREVKAAQKKHNYVSIDSGFDALDKDLDADIPSEYDDHSARKTNRSRYIESEIDFSKNKFYH